MILFCLHHQDKTHGVTNTDEGIKAASFKAFFLLQYGFFYLVCVCVCGQQCSRVDNDCDCEVDVGVTGSPRPAAATQWCHNYFNSSPKACWVSGKHKN